jgi:hypothetical protein
LKGGEKIESLVVSAKKEGALLSFFKRKVKNLKKTWIAIEIERI